MTVAFHGPAFSAESKDVRRGRSADGPDVRPDVAALQTPGAGRAEGRSVRHLQPGDRGPVSHHRLRAREESCRRGLRARRDPAGVCRCAHGAPCGAAARRRAFEQRGTGCCAPSTTPSRSPACSRATCGSSARTTRSNRLFAAVRVTHARGSAGRRAAIFHGRGAGADDACRRDPCRQRFSHRPPWRRSPRRRQRLVNPIVVRSVVPQLNVKLQFKAGSAHDPNGKEGLAALAASMIAEAGSTAMRFDEIQKALFPMAASFDARVDKEQTTFTGSRPPGQLGRVCSDCLANAHRAGLPRGGLHAPQGPAAERARPRSPHEQRGGAREGAPAEQPVRGDAVRPLGARYGGGSRVDHASTT